MVSSYWAEKGLGFRVYTACQTLIELFGALEAPSSDVRLKPLYNPLEF